MLIWLVLSGSAKYRWTLGHLQFRKKYRKIVDMRYYMSCMK